MGELLIGDWLIEPAKGEKPVISWLDTDKLQIDTAYQRAIDSPASQRLIKGIACQWDWGLCSVLLISDRGDDGLFVVDGQHRVAAARLRDDIPHLPCLTTIMSSREAEAKLFVAVNTKRKTVSPLDRFHARCMAGDEEALDILDAVTSAGLEVGKSPWSIKDGEVCSVAVMTRLYRQYGKGLLSAALVNMAEAWPGEPMRIAQEMLPGLCLLLYADDPRVDPEFIPEVLKTRDQVAWFAGAKSGENYDPEHKWPDEVFRDLILDRYLDVSSRTLAPAE